jgi:hypothetical protein
MKQLLKHKQRWLTKVLFIFVSLFVIQSSVIAVSASPAIFDQGHHIGILETYTYNGIESSIGAEVELTGRLSRVLSKREIGSESENTLAIVSSAAKGANLVDDAAGVLSKGDYLRIQNAATHINKPVTVVGSIYEINKFNPLAIAVNSIAGLATGYDLERRERMSTGEAVFNLATVNPAFRVDKYANTALGSIRNAAKGGTQFMKYQGNFVLKSSWKNWGNYMSKRGWADSFKR